MKALYFETPGNAVHVLKSGDMPRPACGPGEVLVRMLASSINPADLMFIQGRYGTMKPVCPQIAGMDGVGIVEDANGQASIEKGMRVAFRYHNAWAEYVAVPGTELLVLPGNFPAEKAAQLVLNAGTAWGLLQAAALQEGDWLLLTAGASTVARTVAQMAGQRGIRVICAVRSEKHAQSLRGIGVQAVIDTSQAGKTLAEHIMSVTDGRGLNGFFDAVGGAAASEALDAMAEGGRVLVYGLLSDEAVRYRNAQILYKRINIQSFRIGTYLASLPDRAQAFAPIIEIAGQESFRMDIAARFPLEEYAAALDACAAGEGKVLFVMPH